jgi:hypothetical protein
MSRLAAAAVAGQLQQGGPQGRIRQIQLFGQQRPRPQAVGQRRLAIVAATEQLGAIGAQQGPIEGRQPQ